MIDEKLKALLEAVATRSVSIDDAMAQLRHLPYEDIGFAKIDHHRGLRDALPEVVLGLGKTPEQVAAIGEKLADQSGRLLVTRCEPEAFDACTAWCRTPSTTSWHAAPWSSVCPTAVCPASRSSAPARPTCRWPKKRR